MVVILSETIIVLLPFLVPAVVLIERLVDHETNLALSDGFL